MKLEGKKKHPVGVGLDEESFVIHFNEYCSILNNEVEEILAFRNESCFWFGV